MWWFIPFIPALTRLRQEDCLWVWGQSGLYSEFHANQVYRMIPWFKRNKYTFKKIRKKNYEFGSQRAQREEYLYSHFSWLKPILNNIIDLGHLSQCQPKWALLEELPMFSSSPTTNLVCKELYSFHQHLYVPVSL